MEKKLYTFLELCNFYNDYDCQPFEEYFCEQLGICPAGCYEDTPEGRISTDDAFDILLEMFRDAKFEIVPNAEYIKFKGKLNSDFRVIQR